MYTMRFWALTAGVVSLLALQPTAQQAKPQNAQQVLDRMAQAMGVAQAAKIRAIHLTGAMQSSAQGFQGRYEVFYKAPNKILVKTTIQGLGEMLQGYDGKVGWAKDPMMGLRELKGAELEQIRQSAESGVQNDVRKVIRNPKLTGQEKVGNRTAHVITAQLRSGSPVRVYIDTQRYLLLRMDIQAATPQGSINVATFFDDYRKVDRIMYAFTTRQLASGVESVIRVERVRHNTPIDDAIFRKPKN